MGGPGSHMQRNLPRKGGLNKIPGYQIEQNIDV